MHWPPRQALPANIQLANWLCCPASCPACNLACGVAWGRVLCKQWTVSVLSIVFSCPAFCAVARPVCHCWCDSSHLVVGSSDVRCSCFTSRSSLAPHVLRRSTSVLAGRLLLPSIRFACIRYYVSLLQPTPTLPLVLKVTHHHHPLYPPPRCLGTFSDLHTNAATCPFRRAYRRACRMFSAALQRVHAREAD